MRYRSSRARRFRSLALSTALLLGFTYGVCPAQELTGGPDPALKLEIHYAKQLTKWGMPDYAEIVMKEIRKKYPQAGALLKVVELEGKIALGKFPEVIAIIGKEPNQGSQEVWAMKLALADGYYAWGKYAEAQGIYESLLKAYPNDPPAGIREFFISSVYKYSQLLLLMGNQPKALKAYERLTQVIPKKDEERKHIRRQILGEMAELLVKEAEHKSGKEQEELLKKIDPLLNELLWVQDLWFGKAIVIMAHVAVIKGDIEGAEKLIKEYGPSLQQMDEILREEQERTGEPLAKLSPMAECRYLLGVMKQDKAERLMAEGGSREEVINLLAGKVRGGKRRGGAIQNLYIVFAKYPETSWAADAGTRANEVKETLERLGAEIKLEISKEQMDKIMRYQFQGARALFNQQQFEPAAENYEKVLALFPEREVSVGALGELSRCYVEIGEEEYAETVIGYIGERFCQHPALMVKAGDELVKIAEMYGERNQQVKREEVYDVFFEFFKKHPRTSGTLFRFGDKEFAQKDYEAALKYYTKVADDYSESPLYLDALSKIAYCHAEMDDHVAEIKMLQRYEKELAKGGKPKPELISVKFRMATAYKRLDPKYVPSALNRYSELVKMLSDPNNPYQTSDADRERNRSMLEGSLFYKALCYSMLKSPPEKVKAYRAAAIKTLETLLEKFPKSKFAPAALSQIGTLYTVLEMPNEAQEAFEKLQKEHPNTPEAKNASFLRGMSLLEMGMRQQAIRVFKEMFAGGGQYSEAQILTAATELLNAGEQEIALEGFERIISSEKRGVREPALLNKGRALLELKRYPGATETLNTLLTEFPRSGYTVEASLYMSNAASELGKAEEDDDKRFDIFNSAVKAIKQARQFARKPGIQAQLDVEVARLMIRKSESETQFGSPEKAEEERNTAVATLQLLIGLGDSTNPEVRGHIEDAYQECWPLLMDMERYKDVIHDSETYLKYFPRGKYALDAKKWANKARMALVTSGEAPATPPPGTEEPGGETAPDESGEPGTAAPGPATAAEPATPAATNAAAASDDRFW